MDSRDFCYWMQGFVELTNGEHPTAEQWELIKSHLTLAFNKKTPTFESFFKDGKVPEVTC